MPLNNVSQFVYQYIIEPIKLDSGYNIVNTGMIAFLFVLAAWLLWDKIFMKNFVKIDSKFIISAVPWLFFGATARVLEDSGIVNSPLFITPFIYGWIGGLSVLMLFVSRSIEKKSKADYSTVWGLSGLALGVVNISLLNFRNYFALFVILALMAIWFALISVSGKLLPIYKEKLSKLAIFGQLFDGTSSFIGITFYGFWEKHIAGRFLIEWLEAHNLLLINGSGAWAIILMKVIVISTVLYFVDKLEKNKKEKDFVKFLIFALGLTLGFRNSIEIAVLS